MHLSGIFIRDYLLDPEREHAPIYRERLAEFRQNNVATVADLRALASGRPEKDERIASLQAKLDDYWQAFDPLFDWTLVEKISQSASFLRREVLPRREAVLAIASEIEELNNANHAIQRAEVTRRHAEFRSELHRLVWGSLALGLIVALTAVIRLRVLERRSENERAVAEEAEHLMRQLSQQLVATQEEERKNLSRELHDHVGQMLTALRMELGRIDRLRSSADSRVAGAVAECRQLVDNMVRTVRDLALGLRPSMLDDFGLQPALEWHVRDFGRRFGIPVELDRRRRFRASARGASHLRLPLRAGSAHQLRAPRARVAHRGVRQPSGRQPRGVGHRRRCRVQSRAAGGRPRPARHRGARPRAPRRPDDPQRARRGDDADDEGAAAGADAVEVTHARAAG